MKRANILLPSIAAALLIGAGLAASIFSAAKTQGSPIAPVLTHAITGDYVEARTASVFAGACHYNGELVTTGRDAILAFQITAGSWNNVDLTGLRAMAAVTSTENLSQAAAPHRSELLIDASATDAQAAALVDALATRCHDSLGRIVAIRRAPITFTHAGTAYSASAPDFAALAIQNMPDDACCKQPNLVWYTPLLPLEHRKVGFTQTAAYTAATLADPWQRSDENSAFYGTLKF